MFVLVPQREHQVLHEGREMVDQVDSWDLINGIDPIDEELPDLGVMLFKMGAHKPNEMFQFEGIH